MITYFTIVGKKETNISNRRLVSRLFDEILEKSLENLDDGITLNGRKFNKIPYADDSTLIVLSSKELTELFLKIEYTRKEIGLKISKNKTKAMMVDRKTNNMPNIKNKINIKMLTLSYTLEEH